MDAFNKKSGLYVPASGGVQPEGPYATWNPADKDAIIVLSNGNLSANSSGSATAGSVRSTSSHNTGKKYFEISIDQLGAGGMGVGIASGLYDIDEDFFSTTLEAVSYYPVDGEMYHNGIVGSNDGGSVGEIISVAVDLDAETITLRRNNVVLNTQDYDFSSMSDSPDIYILASNDATSPNKTVTLITDPNGWTYSPPSGYLAWVE